MESNELAVNTETLQRDINDLKESLTRIQQNMEKMFEGITVLDSMWDGPANDAFNTQFKQDYERMTALCATINTLIENLMYAKKEYDTCDHEVFDIVNSIKI